MVTRTGGFRRKSRYKLSKTARTKGKMSITAFLREFEQGARVQLVAEPAYQNGMYHPRFHGRVGQIVAAQGECYQVAVQDGNKSKIFIVHPVHLRAL